MPQGMPPLQPSPKPFLEVPLFTRSSLLPAISAGARRIELNATGSYGVGGTTPDLALIRDVSSDLDTLDVVVPLRVMIRPRGGDFVYTDEEKAQIHASITEIKPLLKFERGDGFVFGALYHREDSTDWSIDAALCKSVVCLAEPFPVVFHRAFDEAVGSDGGPQVEEKASLVKDLGFKGLLTSGGVGNARDNIPVVKRIAKTFDHGQVEVVVGGGVRGTNVGDIVRELKELMGPRVVYHSSCLSDPGNSEEVDVDEVRRIVSAWEVEEHNQGSDVG